GRAREIAVRVALGARRLQIARLLLSESLIFATIGGGAGLAMSWATLRIAPSLIPSGLLPQGIALHFDARVTLFAAALTGVTGVLFGMAPAWHAARIPLGESLAAGGRASIGGAGRMRNVLAVGEVAGAVLLLAGAGLLVRTLASMNAEDSGYHADSVMTMAVSLPLSRYPDQTHALTFFRRAEAALAAIPGVQSVGFSTVLPLDGFEIGQPVEIAGDAASMEAVRKSAQYQLTSPRYFETLGIPIVKGRAFTDRDQALAPQVCIVNEEFVRRFLRGREPLGTVVKVPNMAPGIAPAIAREIVGVIKQVAIGAGEKEKAVEIYVPIEQNVWYSSAIVLKTAGRPETITSAAR